MPAATPKPIIDKMSAEIARTLGLPDVRERLVSQGAEPFISNPGQFAAMIRAEITKYAKAVKTANIKLDQ
jgi:tripartite-type tricarboxylate transporter receptor subunit TctC